MEKGSKDRKDSPASSERFENLSYERHSGLLPKKIESISAVSAVSFLENRTADVWMFSRNLYLCEKVI